MFDKTFVKFALGFGAIILVGMALISLSGRLSESQTTATVGESQTK